MSSSSANRNGDLNDRVALVMRVVIDLLLFQKASTLKMTQDGMVIP